MSEPVKLEVGFGRWILCICIVFFLLEARGCADENGMRKANVLDRILRAIDGKEVQGVEYEPFKEAAR